MSKQRKNRVMKPAGSWKESRIEEKNREGMNGNCQAVSTSPPSAAVACCCCCCRCQGFFSCHNLAALSWCEVQQKNCLLKNSVCAVLYCTCAYTPRRACVC